jgi:hypothetical protein
VRIEDQGLRQRGRYLLQALQLTPDLPATNANLARCI